MTEEDERSGLPATSGELDPAGLMRLATGYLARYAASSQQLRTVLERKVRRWHQRLALPLPDTTVVGRMVDETLARVQQSGLVDDAAFAVSRARRLVAMGWPAGQIRRRLAAEGLDARAAAIDEVIVVDATSQARRYAARKRLGPFRSSAREPHRDRDIRRLVRAGFAFRDAVLVIDGASEDEEPA